ncbi:MAG TPA: aminotransferase class V-fold PLP-dependent enzyme [Desulfomonilaceae bacterium]|nr:aminotransferase class V-fold PLP-dependent enzyme [Desulfomonilaceae bacterium]
MPNVKRQIYMDNAATSFPKPPAVVAAMVAFMNDVGANPGRSTHDRSVEASQIMTEARGKLAALFNIPDPKRIVFTLNATESLNTVIYGFLNPGDHVIITQMEHNSVIRPVRHLERSGIISVSVAQCDKMGVLDVQGLKRLIRPKTALICLNHASNVCGTIQDIAAVRAAQGEIPLLLDVAQTAGALPVDVQKLGVDFLAFTGHKSLYGPQGTGGLYVREGLVVRPLKRGGTGSMSEVDEQPDFFPDQLESGTQNVVGIAGLAAGVDFVLETGVDRIRRHEMQLLSAFVDGTVDVPGVTLYGPLKVDMQMPILSMTFDQALPDGLRVTFGGCGGRSIPATFDSLHPHEAGSILLDKHEISVRVGLHCAPLAHEALGTLPDGTVRFSMGYFNTLEDVEIAVRAVREIAEKREFFDEDR